VGVSDEVERFDVHSELFLLRPYFLEGCAMKDENEVLNRGPSWPIVRRISIQQVEFLMRLRDLIPIRSYSYSALVSLQGCAMTHRAGC
jgi:hypothetical protein